MDHREFIYFYYRPLFEHKFTIAVCIYTLAINVVSFYSHYHRSSRRSQFWTVSTLLSTYILYALLTLSIAALESLPPSAIMAIFANNRRNDLFLAITPHLSQQIVSVAGLFIALDRVLIMLVPLRHASLKIGRNLSAATALLNLTAMTIAYGAILVTSGTVEFENIYGPSSTIQLYVVSPTVLVETVLYIVFLVQFRRFVKINRNPCQKQQIVEINKIVLIQAICHTSLCTIPYVLNTFDADEFHLDLVFMVYVREYFPLMFVVSVALSSTLVLYTLQPRKHLVKIAHSATENVK
ncbi:hypothetical protein QR680_008896 [Steinernema hermaphroditum]|uniref:Uncharacterized protein n=1 Tax=Steinernema hermaphroditum TaxID=289476 RepID=A0AA39IKR8_9BILA|nr:hypothetical protein QR680_008896 [Steinernema hermaphroditum]